MWMGTLAGAAVTSVLPRAAVQTLCPCARDPGNVSSTRLPSPLCFSTCILLMRAGVYHCCRMLRLCCCWTRCDLHDTSLMYMPSPRFPRFASLFSLAPVQKNCTPCLTALWPCCFAVPHSFHSCLNPCISPEEACAIAGDQRKAQEENWFVSGLKDHRYLSVTKYETRG